MNDPYTRNLPLCGTRQTLRGCHAYYTRLHCEYLSTPWQQTCFLYAGPLDLGTSLSVCSWRPKAQGTSVVFFMLGLFSMVVAVFSKKLLLQTSQTYTLSLCEISEGNIKRWRFVQPDKHTKSVFLLIQMYITTFQT